MFCYLTFLFSFSLSLFLLLSSQILLCCILYHLLWIWFLLLCCTSDAILTSPVRNSKNDLKGSFCGISPFVFISFCIFIFIYNFTCNKVIIFKYQIVLLTKVFDPLFICTTWSDELMKSLLFTLYISSLNYSVW